MSRFILAAAIAGLSLFTATDAFAQRFTPNFNAGPRGPSMTNIGPRGPNFDRPHTRPEVVIVDPGDNQPAPRLHPRTPPSGERNGSSGGGNNTSAAIVGMPPAGENRFVQNEVVIEMAGNPDAMARRHRLTRLEALTSVLTGVTKYRWQISDGRSVRTVIRQLAADGILSQPNYIFKGSQQQSTLANAPANLNEGDPAQYALAKLQLPLAHRIAKGDRVLVAVIDSGIDAAHPELAGVVAGSFDAIAPGAPHAHGTGIAGVIAAHSRLMGVAPAAHILAVRAFGAASDGAEGTTFNILKGLDWAAVNNARIINMSFAGPSDPGLSRALAAAKKRGIVLVAASGNAGAKSPPLYPAADPSVIAVSATDANDKLFALSNRGKYIAVAAPGVDILLPAPGGAYQVSSGTSFAAAQISGIAALILERRPDLGPDAVKNILLATARDLGPKGRDPQFGAGLADAYKAVTAAQDAPVAASASNAAASR